MFLQLSLSLVQFKVPSKKEGKHRDSQTLLHTGTTSLPHAKRPLGHNWRTRTGTSGSQVHASAVHPVCLNINVFTIKYQFSIEV